MNFSKIFFFAAIVLMAVFAGQSEAGWLKEIGKKVERVVQHIRDAGIQAIGVAQGAANVADTAQQG